MALQKQSLNINFSGGLDSKTDPFQVQPGKFLSLENSVFSKGGLLQKRNGYGNLTLLDTDSVSLLTTFNGNLTAIGSNLNAYAAGSKQWVTKGSITPVSIATLPVIRNNLNQTYADCAVASNNYACAVYTENNGGVLAYKYVVFDNITGQNIVEPTLIPSTGVVTYAPKVFLLGAYFIIVFDDLITAVNHLRYFAVSTTNPANTSGPEDISTAYSPAATGTFDGVVFNNNLYLAWNGTSTTIKATYMTSTLVVATAVSYSSVSATQISVSVDNDTGVIYASWINSSGDVSALAFNFLLSPVLPATSIETGTDGVNIASYASGGVLTVYYEIENEYSYDTIPTNYIKQCTVTEGGSVGTPSVLARSVGLASKIFSINGVKYFFAIYNSPYQPTYFLLNGSGQVIARFAYQNGPSAYYVTGLSNVSVNGSAVQFPYLYKDLIQAVNKGTDLPSGSQVNGIYSQTGINLVSIDFEETNTVTSEIGGNLNLSGGFLGAYDGYLPVENNFFLYPDSVKAETDSSGGNLTAQDYFYQVTYEWSDNQGNIFRSSPSIPVSVTTTGSTSTNTISVPTLRLTYKVENPVKIVIYRWSTAQQVYYQVTSITAPLLNNTTIDEVEFDDTLADASILGNNILYTTGGVIENIGGPAFDSLFTFDDRLWGINSENKNLLSYSKQLIENVPVEMSDLLTVYVAPGLGAQGSTGPLRCGAPMDDKLSLFKDSAIYYINGTGPDNTGSNSQYSQPVFITSTVGCSNQKSIVFQPQGLMFEFQSESGNQIWILGRDLSTQFIGADVAGFTQNATIQSAVNVAGANEVRFTLSTGITLVYDYFYQQWGTFTGVPAVSSTIYQGLHTYVNAIGQVFQETPNQYLDGSRPVLMSFTTSWLNMAGLQGYERAYFLYILGTYITPHKLNVQIAYDYNPSPIQQTTISPNNFSPAWGAESNWGAGNYWGGSGKLEQWMIHLQRQLCESFQISISETYDPTYGVQAGAGFTLSGMNLIIGLKKGYKPIAANTAG